MKRSLKKIGVFWEGGYIVESVRPTYQKADAFGGRSRQFSGLSDTNPTALDCRRGGYYFPDRSVDFCEDVVVVVLFFCFFLIFFLSCFWTCLFCMQHECTNQAPIRGQSSEYLRTASGGEQPAVDPAERGKVHTAVRSCRPERDSSSKQTRSKYVAETHTICEYSGSIFPPLCLSYFVILK